MKCPTCGLDVRALRCPRCASPLLAACSGSCMGCAAGCVLSPAAREPGRPGQALRRVVAAGVRRLAGMHEAVGR